MVVLIDVSLSHLFVFLPHHYSLCHPKCQHILLALIHCMSAQSRKGEDYFDLCLTSGLGRVKIRFRRRLSVRFSRLSSQFKKYFISEPISNFSHASYVHLLHGNPYSSHHIYHLAFSRLWLSSLMWAFHTFLSSFPIIILFAILSANISCLRSSIAWVLKVERERIILTCAWLVV